MKHKLSISNKSCNNHYNNGKKIVIAFLISLICIDKAAIVLCSDSAPLEEESLPPISNFVEKCEQRCYDQNRTQFDLNDDNHDDGDTVCKSECTIKQCGIGCSLWENALATSCQTVCNQSNTNDFDNRQIYCIKGCNDASNFYFQWIRQEVQSPTLPPALIPDSLTSTSLALEWSVPAKFSELAKGNLLKKTKNETYFVQCYEDFEDDFWKCENQTTYENSTIKIESLQPYTKYKFRVALLLSENEAIYSEPSVVIRTLEEGIPQSEPKIIQASAVDQTRIMVQWKSGVRNNGPVLSYELRIQDLTLGYDAYKEVPASNQTNYYIFEKLSPGRNYSIKISTRNARGVGPAAEVKTCTIDYLTKENPNEEEPKLIIATEYKVVSQIKKFIGASPTTIYTSNSSKITGIALEIEQQLLYVAEDNGCIYQSSLNLSKLDKNKREVICQKSGLNFKPSLLSVDWLNKHLYILGEMVSNSDQSTKSWSILRCDYEGKNLIVAYGGLNEKPLHVEVDPYNGYLFWVISGDSTTTDGLWKLDLGDISNGIKHEIKPSQMIKGNRLGAFVVDHARFQLSVPFQNENTIKTVTLKGVLEDIRHNTQSPVLHSVKSLVKIKGIFYWTNGEAYQKEEYHEGNNVYFHNSYVDATKTAIIVMKLNSTTIQPHPVPVNPPLDCQALMGATKAKVSWKTPELMHEQGKGAFRKWKYILEINGDVDRNFTDITGNSFAVDGLIPNTIYSFKVAGYLAEKNCGGGWSQNFKGKTLKTDDDRQLIWASKVGLVKSDVIGENITVLMEKDYLGEVDITDITWFEDLIYIVANSSLKIFNTTNHSIVALTDVEGVSSVAVDWIGRRLFWSIPSQHVIMHSNLKGDPRRLLAIPAKAQEIKIDALHGNIYYSTGTAIESRRLNGKNNGIVRKYFQVQPYSGKLVMGLTLDIDNENIYWIVKSQSGSSLYSAKLMDLWDDNKAPSETKLNERNINGPLAHFSDRLVWHQNDAGIVIADMNGTNLALYEDEKINGLTTVAVIDKSYYKYPFEGPVTVIPDPVLNTSVSIIGTYKIFNISWEPVGNINHGEVFYEITIKSPKLQLDIVAEQTSHVFPFPSNSLEPHTPLDIMIISYTSWGASDPIKASIFSPTGFPSVPQNPRVYTKHLYRPLTDAVDISASFRWSLPEHPNGLILGYKVRCIDKATNAVYNKTVVSSVHEYIVNNLRKDADYMFDVQAYTEVGDGNVTEVVHVRTSHERPIPKILVSTSDEIREVDLDMQESVRFALINRPVTAFAYIAHEETLFFISDNHELMMSKIDGNREPQKLTTISSPVQALAIDWIARILYWSQVEDNKGTIYSYNLNNGKSEKVVEREDVISDLVVTPFDRRLFWIEINEKLHEESDIHYLDLETKEMKMLFEKDEKCLNMTITEMSPNPGSLLLATSPINPPMIDNENEVAGDVIYEPLLIFEMGHELHTKFTAVDLASKKCFDLGEIYKTDGTNMAKDSNKVYWINGENVYGREDLTHNPISYPVSKPNRLQAFYQQYFPKKQCLVPIDKNYRVAKVHSSNTTLTFNLPKPELPHECSLKNIPIKYSIRYIKTENLGNASMVDVCETTPENCQLIHTYDGTETINDLKPFTHYSIQIALSSIYEISKGLKFGSVSDFLTENGVPSSPRDVTAVPLSYSEILVSWLKPEIPNAPRISYMIAWETQHHEEQLINRQQKGVNPGDNLNATNEDEMLTTIIKVLPKQTYKISVRAYSKNDTYCESGFVVVDSYPEPKNIKLSSASPTSMIIQWDRPENILSFDIQYTKQDAYNNVSSTNTPIEHDKPNFFRIDALEPKTKYNFSIILTYINSNRTYRWIGKPPHKIEFETLGDRPAPPNKPTICKKDNTIYVEWNKPRDNGADINEYLLESKKVNSDSSSKETRHKRSVEESNDINHDNANEIEQDVTDTPTDIEDKPKEEWKQIYQGLHAQYIYSGHDVADHIFRVKAHNSYGWSDFSPISDRVDNMTLESTSSTNSAEMNRLWLIVLFPAGMILIFSFLICFIWMMYRSRRSKKFADDGVPIPDFELDTIRGLPDNLLVNSRNILYNQFYGPFVNPEIKLLPQIYQHQIIITDRCLGKGAFGEVWSGIVKHDDGNEELVAIKTLHKGANDVEKREFLQEAQLMSNFKHDHILRLIGVCLNQNECLLYIVMELMESGDLLSFLRNNRPAVNKSSSLKLVDLISVCVDVAAGCRYLEEMHFVHRDIAARNCLVKTTPKLTVKLGDFGLARDIYKNDYYRKEGEGLLPVRWMSPESLVDGVFTSQSDIWAFGVLMWEVMTLGQQPYPARTNIEVLHYVRDGGRLPRPNCPDEIFQLMTKCWNRFDHRPTFRHCLDVLIQLHNNFLYHYADVELPFSSDTSCKYVSSDDSSIMNEKLETSSENFQPISIPKYLELAYDENDERNMDNNMCEAPPINYIDENHIKDDGYEIPINFDTELDINANNELNSYLSKSRTLSNSSTISNKSDHLPNYDHHLTHPILTPPQHQITIENCKRSSLILERDKIYPQLQKKILQSGWV